MPTSELTWEKAAYKVTHVLNAVSAAHGTPRFPIDVRELALESSRIFNFDDPITQVQAANIDRFEGALFPDSDRRKWMLLYNERLTSPGRIRFTQAHELGHYLLHRTKQERFTCTEDDLLGAPSGARQMESEADSLAATLLMPLDDFREQTKSNVNFDLLSYCAVRYGVSLTAATLRWLEHTTQAAVLVVHRDGYMCWAKSSRPAMKAGAFFKTRQSAIEVPSGCLGLDHSVSTDAIGRAVSAPIWFPHAPRDTAVLELKIRADQYDWTMTMLVLPPGLRVWKPWDEEARNSL